MDNSPGKKTTAAHYHLSAIKPDNEEQFILRYQKALIGPLWASTWYWLLLVLPAYLPPHTGMKISSVVFFLSKQTIVDSCSISSFLLSWQFLFY